MSEQLNQFSHLPLRLTNQGTATPSGGGGKPSATTLANRNNAGGHSSKLQSSISSIVSSWEEEREKRKEEGKPELPDAISFILQVDPNLFKLCDRMVQVIFGLAPIVLYYLRVFQ
jgi:hypothetical protein